MRLGGGFADGMAQGQAWASNVIKMYEDAKLKSDLKEVGEAQGEESTGFTSQQGKELEGLAAKGYKIDFDQGANAYVARNDAGDTKAVAAGGVTDFMGKRTAGGVEAARASAYADVLTRRDPFKGFQLRRELARDARDNEVHDRTKKQWAKEDGLQALDQQLGQEFEASLVGEDGQRRAPTAADYVRSNQQRAFKLAQGGHMAEAEKAFKDNLATAHVQIQLDAAERKQALGPAMAALGNGDYGAVADFYNRFVPGGAKVTGIEAGKDGGLVMSRIGMDGKPMEPLRAKDQREAMAMLQSLENPAALYQHSQQEFQNQLRLRDAARADNADRRAAGADARAAAADGRAAQAHAWTMQERREIPATREALAREAGMSETQVRGVRAGVLKVPGENSTSREERMRYTSLLGETSRRLTEAQKTLAKLQEGYQYKNAKPGTPQYEEVQGLRDTVAALSEERSTYQSLLAGSQGPGRGAAIASGGLAGREVEAPRKSASPPNAAVEMLKADPKLAEYFDKKYGAGAAARHLK